MAVIFCSKILGNFPSRFILICKSRVLLKWKLVETFARLSDNAIFTSAFRLFFLTNNIHQTIALQVHRENDMSKTLNYINNVNIFLGDYIASILMTVHRVKQNLQDLAFSHIHIFTLSISQEINNNGTLCYTELFRVKYNSNRDNLKMQVFLTITSLPKALPMKKNKTQLNQSL